MNKMSIGLMLIAGSLQAHGSHSHGAPLHDHDHDHHHELIALADEQIKRSQIEFAVAGKGMVQIENKVPGKVIPNPGRYSHIVPYTDGIVRSVSKNVGDRVKKGQVLAVIDSKEVAEARGEFIAASKRQELLEKFLEREKGLREKQFSAENDYLEAELQAQEAAIRTELARQKLNTLGITDYESVNLGRYELKAPFDGTVVSRHLSLGEHVEATQEAFIVADLSKVWVELSLYPKDLTSVRVMDRIKISGDEGRSGVGRVTRMSPVMDAKMKRVTAIAEIDNTMGKWRPGEYISVSIEGDEVAADVTIPKSSILRLDNEEAVFVKTKQGFSPRKILIGQRDDDIVEVVKGLKRGERVVTKNAVLLKFELMKGDHDD